MTIDVNWKDSVYLLPTPIFAEEMEQKPHSERTNDFRKGCRQNTK